MLFFFRLSLTALATALAFSATPALAQGKGGGGSTTSAAGVITIDQAKAEAGGVTPGDAPGFPITISQSGSYRLMSNLTLPDANTSGVVITVPNVTLDLNGFAIVGPVNCGSSGTPVCTPAGQGHGISVASNGTGWAGAAISNGIVRGVGATGIAIEGRGALVERVQAIGNGGDGVWANAALVRDSVALRNGRSGFGGNGISVQSSVASSNGHYGIGANYVSGAGNNVMAGNALGDLASGGARSTSPNRCSGNAC